MTPQLTFDPAALDALMPMHLVVGNDGRIRHVGPTLAQLRPERDLTGRPFADVFSVRRPRELATGDPAALVGQKIRLEFREGTRTPMKGIAVPLAGEASVLINLGFGIALVDAVRDYGLTAADFPPTDLAIEMLYIVEAKSLAMEESRKLNIRLQAAKMEAEEQAFTDPVTGIRNRRALDHVLARMIESGATFTLMRLDLDFFKQVNDTLGHAAGDHVLRAIGEVLMSETRRHDVVARIGGDEFVVVLSGVSDPERIDVLAQRIITGVARPIAYEGEICRVTTSIGSTRSASYAAPSAEQMHRDADAALYAAKRAGRGCHVTFAAASEPVMPPA